MSGPSLPRSLQDTPQLGRWISFAAPGKVQVRTGKVELGQGILVALAQIVAEELEVALERVEVLPADTLLSPNEGFTAGSQSIEVSGAALRLVAAQSRRALLRVAATRSGHRPEEISCHDGLLRVDGTDIGLDFWTLAPEVDWTETIDIRTTVRPSRDYRIAGTSARRGDVLQRLTAGGFIHDMAFDGMRHARIVRQPFRLARLASIDRERFARRHPKVAILQKVDFLAFVGADEYCVHAAHDEAEAFVEWTPDPGRKSAANAPAAVRTEVRKVQTGHPATNSAIRARYSRGYIAHGSIGPSCALAHFVDDRLTVWSHSQGVFALRDQIAACLGLHPSNVRVIHVPGAGCYGHNGADDAALDAAIVACELKGTPVRVQWSRVDELSRGPLGAAMATEIEAALGSDGSVSAWKLSVVSAPQAQRPGTGGYANLSSAEALDPATAPRQVEDLPELAGGGASRNATALYDFPDHEVSVSLDTRSPIRTSSLRSLGAHLNVFAIECAMDELAVIAGLDPIAFRLRHLKDNRCRAVLNEVAAMSGWRPGDAGGEGHGRGVGVARYKNKGAWLAAVAEVTVDEAVRIERLWLCVDAGRLINPQGARAQIEGGALQSASWTLLESVPVAEGRVLPLNWSNYPILRFSDVPEIETRFIIDENEAPLGAGEAAQGPVSAAIGNAVSHALGMRVRDLPLTRERLTQLLLSDQA
ncbi:CO/xanthine dehydrogenase Mo-binding subunit [Rhizobium subbaraonis]|uniref:CO/xanthine dehydrogenase Mo-binding subunit n=1 Tax=Rhizobium subbaraonis TaxID=908946 RepID=A0A285UVY0_9HYPH|nr:molybdopterin cofactor-binding domain-containing protein [Rhizobium subbaraonis]SOC45943.1 CO/xanthine dehydrogenase Mo-binding subunit [Rhizobium subbaraonis]